MAVRDECIDDTPTFFNFLSRSFSPKYISYHAHVLPGSKKTHRLRPTYGAKTRRAIIDVIDFSLWLVKGRRVRILTYHPSYRSFTLRAASHFRLDLADMAKLQPIDEESIPQDHLTNIRSFLHSNPRGFFQCKSAIRNAESCFSRFL